MQQLSEGNIELKSVKKRKNKQKKNKTRTKEKTKVPYKSQQQLHINKEKGIQTTLRFFQKI